MTITMDAPRLARYAMLCAALACGSGAVAAAAKDKPAPLRSLAEAYRDRLKIGAAVEAAQLLGDDGTLLAHQFNSVTAENAMNALQLQPREGEFRFGPADAIVGFARERKMAVHGRALLWGRQTPDWFWIDKDGKPATRELLLARLQRHIDTVLGRYARDVYAWDVVNEAIDPTQPNCLRNDKWLQLVGPDYLDLAFRYARAAAPNARLLLNDVATTQPERRDCLEQVVKGMLARGVPVQGIGHQMHITVFDPTVANIDKTLSAFAALGLENQITELDMSLYKGRTVVLSDTPAKLLDEQAKRYQAIMRVLLAHPELSAVTWWGLSDARTFLNADLGRTDLPLLFDAQRQPKAAYWSILEAAPARSPAPPQ